MNYAAKTLFVTPHKHGDSARKTTAALVLFLNSVAVGCGDGKYPVSGSVVLDDQPVKKGMISFEAADGGPGVDSGGIREGKFELRATPGEKKVRITAYRPRGGQQAPTPDMENYIPARYNSETSLVREVESRDNHFDLELQAD